MTIEGRDAEAEAFGGVRTEISGSLPPLRPRGEGSLQTGIYEKLCAAGRIQPFSGVNAEAPVSGPGSIPWRSQQMSFPYPTTESHRPARASRKRIYLAKEHGLWFIDNTVSERGSIKDDYLVCATSYAKWGPGLRIMLGVEHSQELVRRSEPTGPEDAEISVDTEEPVSSSVSKLDREMFSGK